MPNLTELIGSAACSSPPPPRLPPRPGANERHCRARGDRRAGRRGSPAVAAPPGRFGRRGPGRRGAPPLLERAITHPLRGACATAGPGVASASWARRNAGSSRRSSAAASTRRLGRSRFERRSLAVLGEVIQPHDLTRATRARAATRHLAQASRTLADTRWGQRGPRGPKGGLKAEDGTSAATPALRSPAAADSGGGRAGHIQSDTRMAAPPRHCPARCEL